MIPAGRTGEIRAELDTSKLSGSFGRGITVITDDPVHPKRFLVVRATVLASVELLPEPELRLSNRRGGPRVARLLVRKDRHEVGELRMTDVASTVPWIEVTASRLEQGRPAADGLPYGWPGDWVLEARLGVPRSYGRVEAGVEFKTGLGRQPELMVPVVADLKPPVNLSVERVQLAPAVESGAAEQTVLVAVRRDLDPASLQVETEPAVLRAELVPAGGRAFRLRLIWSGASGGAGEVTFRAGGETFRMPVTASER